MSYDAWKTADHLETDVYDDPDPRSEIADIDLERWAVFLYEVRQFAADHGWANVDRAVAQAKRH